MMDETAQPPERDQSHAREPANPSGTKHRLTTVDPATGQPGRAYEGHTREDALVIARDVRRAFEDWRHTSFGDRAGLMKRAAAVLRRRQGEFAEIMTAEMGKILKDGRAEIEKCAFNCDHYAENAHTYLAREPVDLGGTKGLRDLQPARRRARRHAVELPVLAGLPLRRAGAHGRQRRRAEARQ